MLNNLKGMWWKTIKTRFNYRLKNPLCGLKQAPLAYNSRIDGYLLQSGFMKSPSEPSLHIKTEGRGSLILCLYIDDLVYTSRNQRMIEDFKRAMMAEFEMKDLGLMKYFHGMLVKESLGPIFFLSITISGRSP